MILLMRTPQEDDPTIYPTARPTSAACSNPNLVIATSHTETCCLHCSGLNLSPASRLLHNTIYLHPSCSRLTTFILSVVRPGLLG